ncbi:unnamed protein product [Strongylus vulgaris]|uniref:Cystathionine gamma-lyase n=1 Tax=Strongylus vulgaris TaxID=40348 RepID=A0A3P7LGX8_STRVU|nr:unnamed protein product [Strongylus vulgaris]
MIGFDVGTAANAIRVVEAVRLIVHAVSLGGTESLMEHPLSMTHGGELLKEVTEPMVPPGLLRLSYPGLESHPTHEAAKKYMKNWSGMIGFDVGTAANAIRVVEAVRLIVHAVSLGGTESLMEHPLSMTHGGELLKEVTEPMVPPGLLRLSIGLENADDLIKDLDNALALI